LATPQSFRACITISQAPCNIECKEFSSYFYGGNLAPFSENLLAKPVMRGYENHSTRNGIAHFTQLEEANEF